MATRNDPESGLLYHDGGGRGMIVVRPFNQLEHVSVGVDGKTKAARRKKGRAARRARRNNR